MARAFDEILVSEATGPSGCVALTAAVKLDDSGSPDALGPFSMQAQLISLVTDPNARQRIAAFAGSIARGTQVIEVHAPPKWRSPLRDHVRIDGSGTPTSLVLAIPGSQRRELDFLTPHFDMPELLAPVIVVSDEPELFRDLFLFRPYSVVAAPGGDVLGAALWVNRMMVSLMAPQTYACTDLEDVEAVLAEGRICRICRPIWSASTGLLFASPEEQGVLESAKGALVLVELEHFDSFATAGKAFSDVRRSAPAGAHAILIGPRQMFVRPEALGGFSPVSVLCALP